MTEGRETTVVEGHTVLLPPGWVSLPTDEAAARPQVRRLLDRLFEGRARDEEIALRVQMDQGLMGQLAEARRAGATSVHTLARDLRGLPVSATLVSRTLTGLSGADDLAAALTLALGAADGVVQTRYVRLGDRPALRRLRRHQAELAGPGSPQVPATNLDFVVPLKDGAWLVLAFSTVTEPVWEALVDLFDAIAGSLGP